MFSLQKLLDGQRKARRRCRQSSVPDTVDEQADAADLTHHPDDGSSKRGHQFGGLRRRPSFVGPNEVTRAPARSHQANLILSRKGARYRSATWQGSNIELGLFIEDLRHQTRRSSRSHGHEVAHLSPPLIVDGVARGASPMPRDARRKHDALPSLAVCQKESERMSASGPCDRPGLRFHTEIPIDDAFQQATLARRKLASARSRTQRHAWRGCAIRRDHQSAHFTATRPFDCPFADR
jgi:hypothetical protein